MSEKVAVAEAPEPPLKLGTVLRELAEGTSLHGLPKVVTSRQLAVKILWLLLLLGKYTFVPLDKQTFETYFINTSKFSSGVFKFCETIIKRILKRLEKYAVT